VLPINAGEDGRLPAMEVKLNGVTAKTKPSSGAVLDVVPVSGHALGLLLVDEALIVGIEAEEVDQLAGRVDLSLEDGLRLVEHGGGVERVAPRSGQQLGGLQEHRGAVLPRHFRPLAPRGGGGLDGHVDLFLAGLVIGGQDMLMIVGAHGLGGVAGADFLAADDQRDFDLLGEHLPHRGLERHLFGRSRSIGPDGFVDGFRNGDESVGHVDLHW
jgi:hypothetical protein